VLHSPNPVDKERILITGPSNGGKTSTVTDIAKWIRDTSSASKPSSFIHYGDTDGGWQRIRLSDGSLDKIVIATRLDHFDFRPWATWAADARSKASGDDWIVLDQASRAYEAAKDWYWDKRSGGDLLLPDAMLMGQSDPTAYGGAHGANWDVINNAYYAVMNRLVLAPQWHVLCIAQAKQLRVHPDKHPQAGKAIDMAQNKYNVVGFVPEGKGNLASHFETELGVYQDQLGGHRIHTIREKHDPDEPNPRKELNREPLTSFVQQYLIGAAGWKI
jgi:hypothetical protein